MKVGRSILFPCAAALAATVVTGSVAADAARAADHGPITRVVRSSPVTAIPPSFAGLSIEYSSAHDYFGTPGRPNTSFIRLLRTLAANGTGPPSVRLGGNSSDESWWNPADRPRPAGVETDLSPAWISALRPAADRARVPFILGLNLALDDPANAVAYAQAAIAGLPAGSVRALEIGNQPDLYGRTVTFHVQGRPVTRIQHRPADWSFPDYLADLDSYLHALNQPSQPGWPRLAVGAFAQRSWERAEGELLHQVGSRVQEFSTHSHPLYTCPTRPHGTPPRLLRALLGGTGMMRVVKRIRRVVETARRTGTLVRVTEVNSGTCGGLRGVSDTMGSALWVTDLLFSLAQLGVQSVNIHTFTGAVYAPVEFPLRHGRRTGVAHPLLYGMLLFDRAVPAGAKLLPVAQAADQPIKTWATIDPGGTIRTVVLNKDGRAARVVRLRLPGQRGDGTVQRLLARSVASRSGVTFGGRSFETGIFDGRLHGRAARDAIQPARGVYTLTLAAASAALVTVKR